MSTSCFIIYIILLCCHLADFFSVECPKQIHFCQVFSALTSRSLLLVGGTGEQRPKRPMKRNQVVTLYFEPTFAALYWLKQNHSSKLSTIRATRRRARPTYKTHSSFYIGYAERRNNVSRPGVEKKKGP